MSAIDSLARTPPVIPFFLIEDLEDAQPLAEALVASGLPMLDVTLRAAAALDSIREMQQVPGAIVGAGTVLNEHRLDRAQVAGAAFIMSPGLIILLATAAIGNRISFLPGIANGSDIMTGFDLRLDSFKFFPAEEIGVLRPFRAYASVFRDVGFCPTDGISAERARLTASLRHADGAHHSFACLGVVRDDHGAAFSLRSAAHFGVKVRVPLCPTRIPLGPITRGDAAITSIGAASIYSGGRRQRLLTRPKENICVR